MNNLFIHLLTFKTEQEQRPNLKADLEIYKLVDLID